MPSRAATLSSLSTMAEDAPTEALVLGLPPLPSSCCDLDLAARLDFCFDLRLCLGLGLELRAFMPRTPVRAARTLRVPLALPPLLTGSAHLPVKL